MALKKVRARRVPRPNATLLCRRVVADIARKLPEMAHVRAARILFVAGEARRGSRATVRPLAGKGKPEVLLRGLRALYAITLRPRFFRSSTPEQRVATLLHELLHISSRFDGTLSEDLRHKHLPAGRFEALLGPLLRRYLAEGNAALLAALAHDGEVVARQWLERPTARGGRTRYTEKQLFLGPVRMITRRKLDS
ncbi:MAG TPA: putative metallopeptidase [Myxococcales bacterium]|nr:putative metallopeptidase [Myxococcales bacterium]